MFDKGGRSDLSEKENQEMIILQEYLPEQVSRAGVERSDSKSYSRTWNR